MGFEGEGSLASTGTRCNDTERTLWLMLGVNSLLTGMQIICGFIANSLALLGDGALMAMDGVSYAVSLYAERQKSSAEDAKRLDRIAAFFSAAMLAATTAWVLFDVVERLVGEERESAVQVNGTQLDLEVNSVIMIVFTAVNLAADVCVVLCTWQSSKSKLLEEEASNMNLFGALAHLGADMVRGLAVLLAGILAQVGRWAGEWCECFCFHQVGVVEASKAGTASALQPRIRSLSRQADAYCSLFVCIFVLLATASSSAELLSCFVLGPFRALGLEFFPHPTALVRLESPAFRANARRRER
ncbi:unnamed protein product [Effrenium voratum]|nr:unnamed protein product [Effrenium voratum]